MSADWPAPTTPPVPSARDGGGHPDRWLILVVGIVSFFVVVAGPVGVWLAGRARRTHRDDQVVLVGWVLSLYATVLLVLAVVFVAVAAGLLWFGDWGAGNG